MAGRAFTASANASLRSAPRTFARVLSAARSSFTGTVQIAMQSRAARVSMAAPPMALFGTKSADTASGFYGFTVKDIDGRSVDLKKYKGQVVLVVNVASECGFTPQYKGLAELYNNYSKQGFVILGFPCNQFGAQEPGDNSQIKAFAQRQGAKFPMMAKIDVNGGSADPLYGWLKQQKGGMLTSDIKWNFSKFLIDREGNVVGRYGSMTTPEQIEADVRKYL